MFDIPCVAASLRSVDTPLPSENVGFTRHMISRMVPHPHTNRILVAQEDGALRWFDGRRWDFKFHEGVAEKLCPSFGGCVGAGDDEMLVWNSFRSMTLWSLDPLLSTRAFFEVPGHSITCAARLGTQDAFAAGTGREGVHIFRRGERVAHRAFSEAATCMCSSQDGRKLFCGTDGCGPILREVDVETGACRTVHDVFNGRPVHFLRTLDDGLMMVGTGQRVVLFDTRSSSPAFALHGHHDSLVDGMAVGEDVYATCGKDGYVAIWSQRMRRWIAASHGHSRGVCAMSAFADGRALLSAGRNCDVKVWSLVPCRV